MDADRNLRLGYPDRADLVPLLYPLVAGWVGPESPWRLEMVPGTPGDMERGLLDGSLDAALVPPLLLSRQGARLEALGGWGVACEGPSDLALLLAPRRLDMMDAESLSVAPMAEGSTAEHLIRLLLKPYYDITLNFLSEGGEGYSNEGARLMFGDGAAREAEKRPEGWVAEDMGVAWFVLSGLPTVWEILAAARDLERRKPGVRAALDDALTRSRRSATEQSATLLDDAANRLGWKRDRTKEMLSRRRYTVGTPEQKALARFFTLAGG
jgi:predicted solute-binding protein